MKTREKAWDVRQREKARSLWVQPKIRAAMQEQTKIRNGNKPSVELLTGAQGDYDFVSIRSIFE